MGILNKLFGIEIRRPNDDLKTVPSFVPRESDDGAMPIAAGGAYGTYVDLDGSVRSISALINKYREMAEFPEVEWAIDDIVNQGIVQSVDGKVITLNLDDTTFSDNIKEKIRNEFEYIQKLYKFNSDAYKIFRQWYIDGRLFYHVVVDPNNVRAGIKELRYIDPRKIRVVRETNSTKPASPDQVPVINFEKTYYVYNDKGFQKSIGNIGSSFDNGASGVKIAKDSIIYVPSGKLDKTHTLVVSFLHTAIKPLNNLRAMQDAVVIYRICVVGDTRVKTEYGTKYIKDIDVGDKAYVFTVNNGLELADVKNKWMTGIKPVYKVKSKHFEITATETHPILVLDKETNICSYVPVSDLDIKKHMVVNETPKDSENLIAIVDYRENVVKLKNYNIWVELDINGKEKLIKQIADDISIKKTSVRNFLYGIQYLSETKAREILDYVGLLENAELDTEKEKYWWNQINLPPYIDKEFARLFGFLIGDGSVDENRISFAEGVHPEQNEFYADILRKYFGNCERQKDADRQYVNWCTSNTLGASLLKELGFISGAKNKRIPQWVFAASNDVKKAFIEGFADADAHIRVDEYTGRWQAEFGLCNKRLVEDIKDLWTELGLASGHIRHIKNNGGHICGDHVMPATESWHVYISDIKLPHFEKIDSIEYAGDEEVYDIEVDHEKHNFIANGLVVHNSRASERRIFYIDIGNMPKPKAEQYMNDIMTRYKNKLSYDSTNGDVIQMSKVQTLMEDFWLPRREGGRGTEISVLPSGCLAMDTQVPLLDGRILTIKEIADEWKTGKELWTYSAHPKTGAIVPGLISWAGVTQESAKVMKLTFDNGKELICTPDHKFPVIGKDETEAKDLQLNDSMFPFNIRNEKISDKKSNDYRQFFDNEKKQWKFTHRMVASYLKDKEVFETVYKINEENKNIIHHKDFNRFNNNPSNLTYMGWGDHRLYHQDNFKQYQYLGTIAAKEYLKDLSKNNPEAYQLLLDEKSRNSKEFWNNLSEDEYKILTEKISSGIQKYIDNLSDEERNKRSETSRKNFTLGNIKVREKLNSNIEFREYFTKRQSEGWSEEAKENVRQRNFSKNGIKQTKEQNKSHQANQKLEFDVEHIKFVIDLVKDKTTHQVTANDVVEALNNNQYLLELFQAINAGKHVPNFEGKFNHNIVINKLPISFGYKSWTDFRRKESLFNHRLIKIEYLDEPIQVGTLTIDRDEIYHDYHTFALAIGIITKNSNLGEMADVEYFQKLLYKSLNVPTARLESSSTFNLGRGAEISRDEDKFSDFITRLRLEFSNLFVEALEKQLIFKEIIKVEDWENNVQNIHVRYADNSYYAEMRDNEILNMRVETLNGVSEYIGQYFSRDWVMKNVLRMTEDDIVDMMDEIEQEREDKNNLELSNQLDDLKIQATVQKSAEKLGVIIDPQTGEPMPPEMLPPPQAFNNSSSSSNK